MYPIEYMWTKDETDVTTTSITADNGSINMDQLTSRDPELIQVAMTIFSSYWLKITWYRTNMDKNAEIETRILVTSSEFLSPIYLPKKPEIIDAAKGRNKIESSMVNLLIHLFLRL